MRDGTLNPVFDHSSACPLLVFEAVPPFRGVEAHGAPELVRGEVSEARAAISGGYLGPPRGGRYAKQRSGPVSFCGSRRNDPKVWGLAAILPTDA